ncbi:hypothetical protein QYE76_039393 [Lolium multiflorum]|uniref:CCHC-type domain-containing protein n=1 Tax=Lolium multiflorum TaxID=4521 RepID=A0AAD8T993_LOLMU|nr:hypothetical protein QYE76_039393 [Lolium multiflorum]
MNAGRDDDQEDFKLKFSKYHVPQGLIKKMRDEFRELKQGRMSVGEYRDRFLLCQETRSNAIPVAPKDKSTITCYECGVVGHYSNECPKRIAKTATNPAAPANSFAARRNQNNHNGRLYHMNATEAQEAAPAMPRIPGVAWHYISPPSTFNVLLDSYWFDKPWFLTEGNLLLYASHLPLGVPNGRVLYANPSKEIFSELDEINARVLELDEASEHRVAERGHRPTDTGWRGEPWLRRLIVSPDLRRRLFAYRSPST